MKQPEQLSYEPKPGARKVLIGGSRDFTDYELFKRKVKHYTKKLKNFVVVTGDANRGADKLARLYAFQNGITYHIFRAEWDKFEKAAGPIRNQEMTKFCEGEFCILFWDGDSPGTKDMLSRAKKFKMKIRVVRF